MKSNPFEQQVSDRMDGYRVAPAPEVWTRVEAELHSRRRRRFLWWWLPGIAAGIGLCWFLAGSGSDNEEMKRDDVRMTEPVRRSTVEGTQTDGPFAKQSPGDDRPAEPIMAERKFKTSNHSTQDDQAASITVMHNRRSTLRGKPNSTSPAAHMMGKNGASEPGLGAVADQPASRHDQASYEKMLEPVPASSTGSNSLVRDSASNTSDITKLSGSALEQDTVKRQPKPSAWIRWIGLGGGMSKIGGNIKGISGIGLSYGLDMQWYRPIGKSRFGISAGIGVEGFTTKAGGSRTADLYNTAASMTSNAFASPPIAQGMQWFHRIDLPLKVHFSPNGSRPGQPGITAGIIPGFFILGPEMMTATGNAALRRWQWAVSLEASTSLSKRTNPRTRPFLRWEAGLTDLWKAPSALGSRASFLECGIRRTLR